MAKFRKYVTGFVNILSGAIQGAKIGVKYVKPFRCDAHITIAWMSRLRTMRHEVKTENNCRCFIQTMQNVDVRMRAE